MKRIRILLILVLAAVCFGPAADACTSAIIGPKASRTGRAMLWKHRDTGARDNFIERVEPRNPGDIAYTGLFNGGDLRLREAWMGVNDEGFAIMNTASYNLAPDTAKIKDREGLVMALALSKCRTLKDFATLLDTLPRPMGIQANFGVIDMTGDAGYFEANDVGYKFFPLSDAENGVLIRTNFSESGGPGGSGHVRYRNACYLIDPHIADGISAEFLTDTVSCSYYQAELGRDVMADGDHTIADKDFIPRATTTASVVITLPTAPDEDGVCRSDVRAKLGYPPVADAIEFKHDALPEGVRPVLKGGHAPLNMESLQRRKQVFQSRKGSKTKIVNLDKVRQLKR